MAEAPTNEEKTVTKYLHRLVCQLCDKIFEEDIPIACVHLTFCRSCLKQNGLHDDLEIGMVCTECTKFSVGRNPHQQDVLRSMHLRAKCRRGLLESCSNDTVSSLCKQLNEALTITGDGHDSLQGATSAGSSQPTKPCGKKNCKTCKMVEITKEVCIALTGPNGNTVKGRNGSTVVGEGNFTCLSAHVIYFIYCKRKGCKEAYVGQTPKEADLRTEMTTLRAEIKKGKSLVAKHFKLDDHSVEDCKVCVIKSISSETSDEDVMVELIQLAMQLGTLYPHGLNVI